jgi:hypothetical protein
VVRETTLVTIITQNIKHELQVAGMKVSISPLVQLHLGGAARNYLYRQYRNEMPQHLVNLPSRFLAAYCQYVCNAIYVFTYLKKRNRGSYRLFSAMGIQCWPHPGTRDV